MKVADAADRLRATALSGRNLLIGLFDRLARPLLRTLHPELAHELTLRALGLAWLPPPGADDPGLAVEAFGLSFANPLGIAAGFDKNAHAPDAVLRLGCGFAEVGTVTPRPQKGNPRPRLFRLDADEAVINRLGFNNDGAEKVRARLAARRGRGGIVGVNVGANRDAASRTADYVAGVAAFLPVATYLAVNVSSPNTPGLRDLQARAALDDLLGQVIEARDRVIPQSGRKPILLKIAPDLALTDLDDVVAVARARRIDGMIVGNTTLARPASLSEGRAAREPGGLSGRPLFHLATRMLAETFVRVERAFPLIGVGGIDSGAAAYAKIKAGASLIQLYTGLVFRGVSLIDVIKQDLLDIVRLARYERLSDAVGLDAAALTAEPWPN